MHDPGDAIFKVEDLFMVTYPTVGLTLLVATLLVSGCGPMAKQSTVSLAPNDPRPIVSVHVADVDEAALLMQHLALDVVRVEGLTAYFFDDPNKRVRLAQLGYEIKQQNSHDVFRRVVRIDRSVPETDLIAQGIKIINRQEKYLVIDATLGQLRALVRSGSQITAVAGNEPRPRQIRIVVDTLDDVARIGEVGVDIYSAKPERTDPGVSDDRNRRRKIVINGAAFDFQIDQIKSAGYGIEILPRPPQ